MWLQVQLHARQPAAPAPRRIQPWRPTGPPLVGLQVGPDGVLSIESGSGLETTVEVEEGMEIDRGYISPQFVTNNERLTVEMENVRVLVTDQKIEKARTLP